MLSQTVNLKGLPPCLSIIADVEARRFTASMVPLIYNCNIIDGSCNLCFQSLNMCQLSSSFSLSDASMSYLLVTQSLEIFKMWFRVKTTELFIRILEHCEESLFDLTNNKKT